MSAAAFAHVPEPAGPPPPQPSSSPMPPPPPTTIPFSSATAAPPAGAWRCARGPPARAAATWTRPGGGSSGVAASSCPRWSGRTCARRRRHGEPSSPGGWRLVVGACVDPRRAALWSFRSTAAERHSAAGFVCAAWAAPSATLRCLSSCSAPRPCVVGLGATAPPAAACPPSSMCLHPPYTSLFCWAPSLQVHQPQRRVEQRPHRRPAAAAGARCA